MRATLLRLAMMGLGTMAVSSCAPIPPTSSPSDDNGSLPAGNPATPSPSGTQPVSGANAPARSSKKTMLPETEDWSKPTPTWMNDSPAEKVPAPPKTAIAKKTAPAPPAPEPENPPPPQASETADTTDAGSSFDNLELVDTGLGPKLGILRVGSDRTDANLLSVVAGLKNKTGHELDIEIQTIYKDKAGTPLSGGTGSWIPIKLKSHESTDYRSVALSPEAIDFMVRVRLPHKPAAEQ